MKTGGETPGANNNTIESPTADAAVTPAAAGEDKVSAPDGGSPSPTPSPTDGNIIKP